MTTREISPREIVLGVLMDVTKNDVMSHIALRNVLEKYQYLDKRDRAFITRVSEGTIERMLELDYIIDQFSSTKTRKMKPVILNILRSAVYQMKYMDSVPDAAACNEAVQLAVRKGFKNLRGFVNGVLRSIARGMDQVKLPDPSDKVRYLSVVYSMPEWIVGQWIASYGEETTERILSSLYQERPTAIRCNEQKIQPEALMEKLKAEGVEVRRHPELSSVLLIRGYDHLGALESFCAGDFQVQDAASVRVAEAAGIKEGDYVIDVCAAPGGKALHAAQILNGTGHVEARDLTEQKVALIWENIHRMGFENIEAVCQDALVRVEESVEKADVVLADLPCSGLGVLAKKTDLKYRMTQEQQKELAALQREILRVTAEYVKSGGTLIYSTCTINKGENEENAAWFRNTFTQFEMAWEKQILPTEEETDGFYIARFEKRR